MTNEVRLAVASWVTLTWSACAMGTAMEGADGGMQITERSPVDVDDSGTMNGDRDACDKDSWDHDTDGSTACVAMTVCSPGQYVKQPGTTDSDRQCASCASGSFSTTNNATECDLWTRCDASSREAQAGTATADRTCKMPDSCDRADVSGDGNPCNNDGDTSATCQAQDADVYTCACSKNWRLNAARCLPRDCSTILAANPAATDGMYLLDPSTAAQGYVPMVAHCDMTSDGGGWTLVLSYSHKGGTNPSVRALSTSLPELGSPILGTDGSTTAGWGHADNALFTALCGNELRFEGRSSGHGRRMNFVSSDPGCVAYFGSGTGNCRGLASNYRELADHGANLPSAMDSGFQDRGDQAMTAFPFYRGATFHWGVGTDGRWEIDDFQKDAPSRDTLHRIWVRNVPRLGGCREGQ